MVSGNKKPFENQLNSGSKFKNDLLSDLDRSEWPGRIDYVARRLNEGDYSFGLQTGDPTFLEDGRDLDRTAREYYLKGIAALTGDRSRKTALPDDFRLGELLVQFSGLRDGLEDVDRKDVPPGEILSRVLIRNVQRQARGRNANLARQLRADTETPRELVAELTSAPELAPTVEGALPDTEDPATLTTELASLDLTTELWDHQLESLALWLHHDMHGYVDMATATGKTVLGLATVAHAVDSGSLHPADQERLSEIFDGSVPELPRNRPNNVLIVTTDDLLGIQWARLFQEHCHTPPAFTQIEETGIQLPWGRIDIRSARDLDDVEPKDYRLAIFDEVHNYSGRSGWGNHLVEFIESTCPVLALTGSVTEEFESLVEGADRDFPVIYRYTHKLALEDGVIPDFEWTLQFTDVTDSDALDQFRDTADKFNKLIEYDAGVYKIAEDSLGEVAPELSDEDKRSIAGEYLTGSAVAKGLREPGENGNAPTDWVESLASGLGNRTIHRLNLRSNLQPIIDKAEQALSDDRPVLILTRSYSEGKEIWQELYDRDDDKLIKRLEADQPAEKQDEVIQSFDDADTKQKALIGPGKRIGQGSDIHSVEVGINISRPGSGVNATLVQRLGRLLRDAGDKDSVDFYHVVGVPPADAAIEPDGESFVRTVSEFFAQVLEPNTDGILKAPSVSVEESVREDIIALEGLGAPSINDDDQSTMIESAYGAAIEETSGAPAVTTKWFSAAVGETAQPAQMETKANKGASGDEKPVVEENDGVDADEDTTGNSSEQKERTQEGRKADTTHVENSPIETSPLAEHYEAFRSVCIIHKVLIEKRLSAIDESSPFRQWVRDVRSLVDETGFESQDVGYGKQLSSQDTIDIGDYRTEYGDGERVTDFQTLSVSELPALVKELLGEFQADLGSWVIPISPQSDNPLPVLVESEVDLERGRELLREFPERPSAVADTDSIGEEDETDLQSTEEEPENGSQIVEEGDAEEPKSSGSSGKPTRDNPSDSAPVPVEGVRGVSDSVAEALRSEGYEYMEDLRAASDEELSEVKGISPQRVTLIRAAVGSG